MVGGRFLSADHSHKFAKVVLIQGNRGFEGLYVVMNEFGKILGWWFVSGTTLREVESSLRGINRRYMLHGFQGPLVFTTDRCCDERDTIAGNNNAAERPMFSSFEKANKDASVITMDTSENENFIEMKEIDLPSPPVRPSSKETAEVTVCEIIRQCEANNWDTIAIDSEWNRGTRTGPEVLTIGTPDSRTYLLHKSVFPPSLKILLESETIKKVANRISSDKSKLKEIGINLAGAVELGWLAKERGIVNRRNPNLEELVEKLFDCRIDKDLKIRLSDWSKQDLSKQQIQYAVIDVYAHMFCYLKLLSMPFLDPKKVKAPKMSELKNGESVLLYTKNHAAIVATGVFVAGQSTKNLFGTSTLSASIATVRITQDGIRILSAVVPERGSMSLAQLLQEDVVEEEATGFIEIPWKLKDLRVSTTSIEPQEQISVMTKMVSIRAPSMDDEDNNGACPEPVDPTNNGIGEMEEDAEHDNYFHKGVKQDIEHIFLRFARVLTKGHGVFGAFMSRLSDAFFVPSQEDIEFIKAALRRSGVSDEDIKKKRWQYYKRRVRRRICLPKELEREFNRVVNLFANLEDAKTGKPLFGEKAWALYKSTLRHIRKGCLSDIPGMAYYVQTCEDSMGIPVFTCVRGTSALEGFHQKIRQVIRGFNVSPRYAIALLHEFIYRWNHDVDVRILGLPTKYANYYDGWEIEEEIEQTCSWEELEKVAHSCWESTKDYAPTGETFALIRNDSVVLACQSRQDAVVDDDAVDAVLDAEIAKVVDAMNDGTLDDTQEDSAANVMLSSQILTESAAWVGKQLGVERGQGPVRRASEKTFFESNYHTFQNSGDDAEADNFAAFAFGRFALFWNEWIAEEESGDRPKSDMTLKNAYHLQAYWKQLKKDGNCVATLLPVRNENKALRREYRGQSRQTNATIPDSAPAKVAALQRKALLEATSAAASTPTALTPSPSSTTATNRVVIQAFAGQLPRGMDTREYMSSGAKPEKSGPDGASAKRRKLKDEGSRMKASKAPYRCRQCGHSYGLGQLYAQHHVGRGDPGQARRAKKGGTAPMRYLKPHEVCSVPEELRKPGFPLNEGERMPRGKQESSKR
jgi:hypothetical protein